MSDMAEIKTSEPAVNEGGTLSSFWFLQRRNAHLSTDEKMLNTDELFCNEAISNLNQIC